MFTRETYITIIIKLGNLFCILPVTNFPLHIDASQLSDINSLDLF